MRKARGFTMVELIVVMAVLIALALLILPSFTALSNRAKVARASEEIRALEKDISAYFTEKGVLPETLGDVHRAGMLDPWGHEYVYRTIARVPDELGPRTFVGDNLSEDYDLYSTGKDGASFIEIESAQSSDDIIRAGTGAYVGSVFSYTDLY